jgi:predicted transcriptional regulator
MRTPCQVAHWYLIPAITAELSKRLAKMGMKQSAIAKVLGLTPAAVSNYLKSKRGSELKLSEKVKKRVDSLAKDIHGKSVSHEGIVLEVCDICAVARRTGGVCHMHSRVGGARKGCGICGKAKC